MEVSRELEKVFANEIERISTIEIRFNDGTSLLAIIKKVSFIPLEVIVCKRETVKGEYPYVTLDFEEITSITFTYFDGSQRIFP